MRRILSGRLNNKGVTLITLIIAITIFAIFITVFSYVMVAKHGASALYVQSTQAYAVAQAGIEYGIRCATDNGYWATGSPGITESLGSGSGSGSFTLVYDDSNNTLTSTGTVGVAERAIILASFSSYVESAAAGEIVLDPPAYRSSRTIYVPLINNYGEDVDITNITLAKTVSTVTLSRITFGSTTVWSGSQDVSATTRVFTFNYTMAPGSVTLSLTASSRGSGLSGAWDCTFSDPQSSSVEFDI